MTKDEALKLATGGLEKILGTFEKDGKFVMKSMIRNELFDEVNLLLKKAKKALAKPVQPERQWVGLTDEEVNAAWGAVAWHSGKGLSELKHEYARATEAKLKEKNA